MKKVLFFIITFISLNSFGSNEKLGYMGRIASSNGTAISGPVDLNVEILTGASGSQAVRCQATKSNVPLANGVFNIEIDYNTTCDGNSKKLSDVLKEAFDPSSPVALWIRVTTTNTTPNVAYGPNPINASPVSIAALNIARQGVENTSIKGVTSNCSAGEVLKADGSGGFSCSNSYLALTGGDLTGDLTTTGDITATAFYYTSDKRKKKNIKQLDGKRSLENIKKMNGYHFNWKHNNKKDIGFIAQEVQQVYPQLVSKVGKNEKQHLAVKYGNIISIAIEAIKEQQRQIEKLEQKVRKLEKKLDKK